MVSNRIPQRVKDNKDLQTIKESIINEAGQSALSDLSLEQLADRYGQIDQQSQFLKGLILLEARQRFSSNNEFGEWVESVGALCSDTRQARTRFMNFASYFKDKDREGISLTACYEISAPINADVADRVYQAAFNKNLSVAQIKTEIAKAKGLLPESVNEGSSEPELMPFEDLDTFKQVVLLDIQELSKHNAISVLRECLKEIQNK
ncbi:MAG: hypothetical protein WBI40_11760 [Methylococcaceae bacterium]